MNVTGWDLFSGGQLGMSGNAIIRYGGGTIFFTGFWALLIGALLVLAGALMLARGRLGGVITLVVGLLGTAMSATNVVMVYTKMRTGSVGASVGIGLWLFIGLSVAALVIGIVGASTAD